MRAAEQFKQYSVNMVTIRLNGTKTHFAGWGQNSPIWLSIPDDRIKVYMSDEDVDFLADFSSLRRKNFDVVIEYWKARKR